MHTSCKKQSVYLPLAIYGEGGRGGPKTTARCRDCRSTASIPNSIVIAGEADSYAYDCYYLNIASQMVLPLFTYDDKMKKTAEERGIKCL